jgi:hypothetical protein
LRRLLSERRPYVVSGAVDTSVVAMSVVHVRHVWVQVSHWLVFMGMRMWFAGRIGSPVRVPVVDVMHVRMGVHEGLVNMLVLMTLCQM